MAPPESDGFISEALGKVALNDPKKKMTPVQVESIFKSKGPTGSSVQYPDDEPLPAEEKERRVLRLKEVLVAVQIAWITDPQDLDLLAEKVADGLRNASWRPPMGESGLLKFFLDKVPKQELPISLRIQILRVIGNSCADTDENRAMVVERNLVPIILDLPADNLLLPFHIPVVYNICLDYEPAQLQACKAGLSAVTVELTCTPRVQYCHAFFNVIFKCWSLIAHREEELTTADPLIPVQLLGLLKNPPYPLDAEDYTACISLVASYLSSPRFQEALIANNGVPALLEAFEVAETAFDLDEIEPDDAEQLKQVRNSLVRILSDISDLPSFAQAYPLKTSSVVKTLRSWLANRRGYTNIISTACIMLGNLARSDDASIWLVQTAHIHKPLIDVLSPTLSSTAAPATNAAALPPSELLFSVLSILKNLAIPAINKPFLGSLLDNILPPLWTAPDLHPQAQFAAVSLARLLATGCAANVRRMCAPLSSDPGSPAAARSKLHIIASLVERAATEPTRIEAARLALAVCRLLHTSVENHPDDLLPPEWPATTEEPEHPSPLPPQTTTSAPTYQSPASPPSTTTTPSTAPDTPAYSATSSPLGVPSSPPTSCSSAHAPPPFIFRRARYYAAHADLKVCLSLLLEQSRFALLRSEAWFVLALMARSRDGAAVALWVLGETEAEATGALYKAVTGREIVESKVLLLGEEEDDTSGGSDSPKTSSSTVGGESVLEKSAALQQELGLEPQQVETSGPSPLQKERLALADRENGLVLVTELLRTFGDQMPQMTADLFRGLMKEGGEIVAVERRKMKVAAEGK